MKKIIISIISLLSINYAHADNNIQDNDSNAYCNYVTQKAQAKNSLFTSPDIFFKVGKNENDKKLLALGVSKSLADYKKGELILRLADNECRLYQANKQANEQLKYALPSLEKNALTYKLKLFQQAKLQLGEILKHTKKQVESKNETVVNLYNVELMLQKIELMEQETQMELAKIQIPYINTIAIDSLLNEVTLIEKDKEATAIALDKQDNWDIEFFAGVKQNILSDENGSPNVFLGLNAKYNIGSNKSNRLLDASKQSYMQWKQNQTDGLQQTFIKLKTSLAEMKTTQQDSYNKLLSYQTKIDDFSDKIKNVSSNEALKFKTQLQANKIMQDVEIQTAKYKIDLLENYLK